MSNTGPWTYEAIETHTSAGRTFHKGTHVKVIRRWTLSMVDLVMLDVGGGLSVSAKFFKGPIKTDFFDEVVAKQRGQKSDL